MWENQAIKGAREQIMNLKYSVLKKVLESVTITNYYEKKRTGKWVR